MAPSPLVRRLAALGLLLGAVLLVGLSIASTLRAFMEGQWEIADKQAQLRNLRGLAEARNAFARLAPRKNAAAPGQAATPILSTEADATSALQAAVNRAAEGQQVIVDGTEALPPEAVTRTTTVHLRGTQAGLYAFLRSIEDQTPYVLVPRLEVTPSRSADPEHGKPFVVSADLRVAVLVAPAVPSRRSATPGAPAEPALP